MLYKICISILLLVIVILSIEAILELIGIYYYTTGNKVLGKIEKSHLAILNEIEIFTERMFKR